MDFNYRLWADNGTHFAASTITAGRLSGKVTGLIELLGDDNAIVRTHLNTQLTTLAPISINCYFASHTVYKLILIEFSRFDSIGAF